jgi:hypothetical protein
MLPFQYLFTPLLCILEAGLVIAQVPGDAQYPLQAPVVTTANNFTNCHQAVSN